MHRHAAGHRAQCDSMAERAERAERACAKAVEALNHPVRAHRDSGERQRRGVGPERDAKRKVPSCVAYGGVAYGCVSHAYCFRRRLVTQLQRYRNCHVNVVAYDGSHGYY